MSLELSRIVNDALQCKDFEAAFAPLYEQPNLRPSELPKVEKKSLTVLAQALGVERHVRFWVTALFSPQNSVHLFAYKTLLRLGPSLRLLSGPLHEALEKRWQSYHRETSQELLSPLPRNGMARVVEVFFCADPQLALDVAQQQTKFFGPLERRTGEVLSAYFKRRDTAREVLRVVMEEIREEERERHQQTQSVVPYVSDHAILMERARLRPEVAAASEAVGLEPVSPYSSYPHWDCQAGIGRISQAKTEPQKTVRAFLTKPLQENYKAALLADQAGEELLFGLVHHSLVDNIFYGQLIALLTSVIQEPQAGQELRESIESRSWSIPPRLLLWKRTLNALAQNYTEFPSLEKARQLYALLHPLETPEHYGRFCSNMRAKHGEALLTAPPDEKSLTSPQAADPTHFKPYSFTVAMPTAEYPEAQGLFPPATRQDEEDAVAFLVRVYAEYAANVKKLEKVSQQYHETFRQTTQATHYGHHAQTSALRSQQYKAFEESLKLFTPAEKHEIMVYLARGGEVGGEVGLKTTPVLSLWAKSDEERLKLLEPVTSQLWEGCAQSIEDIKREEKRRDTQGDNTQAMSRAYEKLDYLQWEIIRLDGHRGRLAVIQMASKHRATSLVQRLEWSLLGSASEWRMGEDRDEYLAYFAKRLPRWRLPWRRQGYGLLASVLYQCQTPELRRQSWEFTALAGGVSSVFFEAVKDRDDAETWAELLCTIPQKDVRFFELWSRWRKHPELSERAFYDLLNVLPRVTTEQSVFMVLPMLAQFTPEERIAHVETWAQTLEHPHPKIAKWAFEILLAIPHSVLDWERAIEAAGEKLWSENLGLTKVAARFLSTAPAEYALFAWDKLREALELENTALAEAVLRAMAALLGKDPSLRLPDAAQDRLASLVQLAPERFGPLQRRLGAALVSPEA